jgi:hypothetical protein
MPDQFEQYYKYLKANGADVAPDFNSFKNTLSNYDNASKYYSYLKDNQFDVPESYDSFADTFGLKKKDQGVLLSVSSPTQSLSPDFEKGKAFAEKGFLMQAEGTKAPKKQKISIEPSLSLGGAPKVKVIDEDEETSILADFTSSALKGQIQGKVANILSAGKRPTPEELGEIAQLQTDLQLFPQSKSEKAYQEKGLKGLFTDSPGLGVQFIAETMASSLSSLFEASKRTVPTAVAMGAAAGAPFAGIGALVGAGTGLLAGQSAAGYNISTSQDILSSLSENGVDISNKDSLINAFSDEAKMAKIRNTAVKYGVPILVFDALTAGLAGKLAAGAVGKSLSKKLLAGLGETGLQITGGSGGELTAQIASGKKVNWDEIIIEGLAEVPGGVTEVATGVAMERSKTSSNNKTLATQIATQGVQNGTEDAIINLNRDLANNVITPEQHQEGIIFAEKAAQVSDKIPETVTGESRVKSMELLIERNDIKQANQDLLQQKQVTDEAYHAGIDEEIKANEERIKKLDAEVYDIAKKPSKEFGSKKYIVDGEEVSQAEFEALQGKPVGTKKVIKAESPEVLDLEERRREELRTSLELLPLVSKEERSPELQKRYDKVEAKEKEINAKYDAELAALEEVKPIEVEEIKPTDIKTVEKISSVMPYVVEDRNIVEPVIEKIKNNELINEEELYNAAQVLENLQSKTENESLKNLINPVIDKILTYENQSKTEVSTVTQKGAVTRVGTDVRKKEVSKSIGQFEGSRATITDKNGKAVTGYLKTDDGKYNLYDESGSKIASIGEKQITDRDVVLPSTDVVPNPITIDKNGNIKSITLQLQKVDKGGGVLPDRVITIDFKNAEKALDYAIQLRAEQVGEFSDPEFEEIITQVEQEIPIKKEVKISEPKAEVKPAEVKKEVKKTAIETVSDDLLNYLGIAPSDVKFSKTTGKPEIIKSPESIQTDVVNQMNKMNLVNEGVDLNLSSTTKEKIDVDELNSRLDYPLKKVNFKDFEGYPIMFTISDQLRTGDVVNPNTGQTVKDLKGGIGFNGTKGHENMAWANTTKDEGDGLYIKAQDIYNSNKSLFEKAWANGDLPSGQIPMAVVKMAESSILSNEAVFRTGIQNVETLPKKNRKQAVTNITESLKSKVKIESDAVKRGTDANGKRYAPLTMAAKEKIISQSKNILKIIQEKKYIDIVDLLKDIKIFSLPERAIIVNQVFYGSPTAAGAKEIDINRSKPKTKVSVDLIGNADPSLIHIGKITDLLTEPSTKNIPSTHITAIVGVKVAEKVNGKWVKSGGTIETDHPNYPYGVEGGSIGVLEQPIHMKDAFGEAYGSVLSIITKNEAKKASISEGASFSQGLPVQSGLSNKVFSPAIAKGRLDAVDKLSGFLRQAFPTTTFFTTQEAWNSALEEPNVKKHLKDGDVIYAFTTDGNVYINPNLKTTKAALHETGHIWAGFVKENNSALYDKGLKLVEDTKELKKAIEEYGDTPLAREEALMELMSSKGDTIVNAAQKAKFKEWLLSLYKYISDNFKSLMKLSPKEVENLTLDKFLEGMLADLLSGKELTTGKIKGETKFSKGSQEDAIREFIEIQRKKGISDKEIKAGVEKVSDQIGLDKSKIDDLFKKEAETVSIAYKDLSRIEKRKIINSKFDELIKELKIDKRCQ